MFKVERRQQYDVVDIVPGFLVLALNIFQTCFSISIVDFNQVIIG